MENHTIQDLSERFGVDKELMKKPVIRYNKFLRSLKKQVEEEELKSIKVLPNATKPTKPKPKP